MKPRGSVVGLSFIFLFFPVRRRINPFKAPEPLPILNPSNFVPKNGFPVVKGLRQKKENSLRKRQDRFLLMFVPRGLFISGLKRGTSTAVLYAVNSFGK